MPVLSTPTPTHPPTHPHTHTHTHTHTRLVVLDVWDHIRARGSTSDLDGSTYTYVSASPWPQQLGQYVFPGRNIIIDITLYTRAHIRTATRSRAVTSSNSRKGDERGGEVGTREVAGGGGGEGGGKGGGL